MIYLILLISEPLYIGLGNPTEGNDNSSSTSAPIPNSNVNTNLSKKVNYSDGKNSINLTFDMREYHYENNNYSSQH